MPNHELIGNESISPEFGFDYLAEFGSEKIEKLIRDCRNRRISAFSIIKEIPFEVLRDKFKVSKADYDSWKSLYEEASQLLR